MSDEALRVRGYGDTAGVSWASSYLSSDRGVRLLQQIPQFLPLLRTAGVVKLPLSVPLAQCLCFPPQLLVHLLLFLVIARLAARLQINLINTPVIELLSKRERAHLLHHVQLPGAIEVQDARERARMPVEEVLVFMQAVIVAHLHQRLVRVAVAQLPQPRARESVQSPP